MYKVYILQSLKDGKTYIGYSGDFERRFKEHNSGRVNATKHRQPLEGATSEHSFYCKIIILVKFLKNFLELTLVSPTKIV